MQMQFERNDAAAKSLDGGQWITQSGAYIGTITQTMIGVTDSGAQYVEIAFKGDDGALCFPRLFLTKRDGTDAFGRRILDALMVVCDVKLCEVQTVAVFIRDRTQSSGFRKEMGYRMPALERKRVGLVLQRENREYQGKLTYQMNLLTPFDPQTRKVAKEILEGSAEAKLLDARLKNLKDRDSTGQASAPAQTTAQPPAGHPAASDDIPFN